VNEDERGITPANVTAMTVEAIDDYSARAVVERGNGDSIQLIELTTQEWWALSCMLEMFAHTSGHVHQEFVQMQVSRGVVGCSCKDVEITSSAITASR
jgi:hypothetical protein